MKRWAQFDTDTAETLTQGLIALHEGVFLEATRSREDGFLAFDGAIADVAQISDAQRDIIDRVNAAPGPVRLWFDREDRVVRVRAWTACLGREHERAYETVLLRHVRRRLHNDVIRLLQSPKHYNDSFQRGCSI